MKSFRYVFFILILELVFQAKIEATDAVITLFIKEETPKKKKHPRYDETVISESLMQPSFIRAIARDRSWLEQPGADGIPVSYLGYIAVTDKNGQVTFPRKQQTDIMHLLITPEVTPAFMIGPTLIHNWVTKNNQPAAFYTIVRKKNKNLNTYYFDIKKSPIPQNIPLNTVTIYAHPDHIHVPVGIVLNTYSTNFILPELEAKNGDTIKNSLYTLSIKQYFEQINIESKYDVTSIATMVVNQ
ncbi:MAG: hypothetical protein JO129_02060 [Candidatus Dependentiae bacterium]|nr:hypothetical protein [Candidatus Dependentiae bacterium]